MATINTLELNIVSNVKEAESSLDRIIDKFNNLQGSINKIDTAQIGNLSKSVKSAMQEVETFKNGLTEHLPQVETEGVAEGITDGLNEANTQAEKVNSSLSGLSTILNRIKLGATDFGSAFKEALSESNQKIKSITSSFTKAISKMFTAKKGLSSLFASIKRVAFYRLIRSFIKLITEGIRTGIQNLVKYEAALGQLATGKANKAMSELKTNYQYISNSMGSLATTFLNMVMPAIDTISDGLVNIINLLNQFLATLSGDTSYKKATKTNYDYAQSIEEVKRQTLGFDELNILNGSGTNEGGSAYSDMFVDEDIPTKVSEFGKKIKDTFGNLVEDIKNIAAPLKDLFSAIFEKDWDKVKSLTAEVLRNLKVLIADFLEDVKIIIPDALDLLNSITDGILLEIQSKINSLFDWLEAVTGDSLTGIRDLVNGRFTQLRAVFDSLSEDLKMVLTGIIDFISGILTADWDKAWNGLVTTIKGVFYTIVDTVNQAINDIIYRINLLLAGINKVFGTNWKLNVTLPSAQAIFNNAMATGSYGVGGSMASIKAYDKINAKASGGFVPSGDLFIANEAGAELVTSATGGANVYNQDQLAGSVASGNQGVIDAIYAAISSINSTINNQPKPSIKIGDRDIYDAVERGKYIVGNNFVRGF